MSTPVRAWASAAAVMTCSSQSVMPASPDITLMMPARTPVPAMPSLDVAQEHLGERLGPAEQAPRAPGPEVERQAVRRVQPGGGDEMDGHPVRDGARRAARHAPGQAP